MDDQGDERQADHDRPVYIGQAAQAGAVVEAVYAGDEHNNRHDQEDVFFEDISLDKRIGADHEDQRDQQVMELAGLHDALQGIHKCLNLKTASRPGYRKV